ncbi:YcaO-like family protein, partial [Burkholderia cenocepacia]
ERSLPLDVARQALVDSLQAAGLHWRTEWTGELFRTAKCTLFNADGRVLERGFGKGPEFASEVGAMFEATEHWFGRFENTDQSEVTYVDSGEYCRRTSLLNPLLRELIETSERAPIAVRTYRPLGGGCEQPYPVALASPAYVDERRASAGLSDADRFNYSNIANYCSNSGIAIGSNQLDATIHGLLEAVERDALSDFLVAAFLRRDPKAIRIIARESLPEGLRHLLELADHEIASEIMVLDLTNRFGIPCFCATRKVGRLTVELSGFGCSLDKGHAFRRSVYELVQCFHITERFYPSDFSLRAAKVISRLSDFPFHLRCATMHIGTWAQRIGWTCADFEQVEAVVPSSEPTVYLSQLVSRIERQGHHSYSSVLAVLPKGEHVVHSLIERQEHFYCAMEGSFVLPDPSRWPELNNPRALQ